MAEEQKSPKDQWLERLSNEPISEEAMQDTWTRTVFVKGKSGGAPAFDPEQTAAPGQSSGQGSISNADGSTTNPGSKTANELTGPSPNSLPDANPDAIVGQVIADKYQITGFIGKGGMSSIYSAKHMQLDTIYALKLLDKNMWSDPTAVKRFKLEAQTVSKLTHPSLITYRDFGVTNDGQPYLVMDLIQGRTLSHKIKETRGIFLPTVLEIFEQLCEGLSVAHELGIVHRDVKPGNIMFMSEDSDKIKLVDFGIAKIVAEEGSESQQLTKTGDVFGSPLYMSPEQCMGKRLDNRSDIYSLGCVIFEAMTGRNAISGNTILDTMNKHVSLMPSLPSELRPDLQSADKSSWVDLDEFEYVVMKCLQKNPNDRYKTVDDILFDLRKIKAQEKINRDTPSASVKNLRKTGSFDRTSPKEMFQMVATAAYAIVGIGVLGAIVVIFIMTNKPVPQTPAKPSSESQPKVASQNIVIGNSDQEQDANDLDQKANHYIVKENWVEAADLLETSVNLYKRKGKAGLMLAPKYVSLGDCYYKMNEYHKSLNAFKEAMAIYNQHPPDLCVPQRKESMLGQARALRGLKLEAQAKQLEEEANNL
jgi:serine/threonine protein kinase